MLSDQKLNTLVRLVESQSGREVDSTSVRRLQSRSIAKEQAESIIAYLLAPYEHGYWELKATWNSTSPLSKYLLNALETLNELELDNDSFFITPSLARKLSDEKREELLQLTRRVTVIHAIFCAIIRSSKAEDITPLLKICPPLDKINLSELKNKFQEAFQIFESGVHFDGFRSGVESSRLHQIKNGLVVFLEAPKKGGVLHIIGTEHSDICILRDFYFALGVLSNPVVSRVFAPDEALFRPYFSLVSGVLHLVIQDKHISNVFARSLDYYEEDDFQHCISTLGLIAEDFLQRIYTSLLREQISGGLTLGQTLDRLYKRIDDIFPAPKLTLNTLDTAYEQIKALEPDAGIELLKPVLRELVTLIRDDRSYYGKKIDELVKTPTRRTPFPAHISENINELLKWRNAASHNSRIPLGAHEADRTLYCLVSLITWWQEQIVSIDWSKQKLEIIEMFLKSAKQTATK